jgi:poly(3-hydroxybutyrate) depolymerase
MLLFMRRGASVVLAAVSLASCSTAATSSQPEGAGGTVSVPNGSNTEVGGAGGDISPGPTSAGSGGQPPASQDSGSVAQSDGGGGSFAMSADASVLGAHPEGGTRSSGCGRAVMRPDRTVQQTMQVGGTTRYYLLDVPTAVTNETPLTLIFALHGANMNNVSVVGLYNFGARSNGQAITVYPQGDGDPSGATSKWGSGITSRWTSNDANFAYIEALKTDLENRYCIDPSRVFVTGFSMGGGFTNDLGCQRATLFRAIAPVEGYGPGGLSGANMPTCPNPTGKVGVMITQGTQDTLVTPTMGQVTRDYWTGQNGCNKTTMPSFTGCVSYDGCTVGLPVAYCTGKWGHTIQSDPVTANIWAFFNGLR